MKKYSVVKITVSDIKDHCPFYKEGDSFLIKQQCFDPNKSDPKEFCIHSLIDIYDAYMKIRRSDIGSSCSACCSDDDKVTFKIERITDEEGEGWN